MQYVAIVVALGITAVAIALVARAIRSFIRVLKLGQPSATRQNNYPARTRTMLTESLGHTRMLKWSHIGVAHWFVFTGFGFLFLTLVTAFGQLFDATFALPWIGHWIVFDVLTELLSALTFLGILFLIIVRQKNHPRRLGRKSRFMGSTFWQAYFVEAVILGVSICITLLRGLEGAEDRVSSYSAHYLVTYPLVAAFRGASESTLHNWIYAIAAIKIVISFTWVIVIASNLTMGVAWHRFAAFPNIFFKRNPGVTTLTRKAAEGSSATSLGPLQPMYSRGALVNFEDPGEDDLFGVGQVEHFTWKGLLDFTTCTECGRCQSQCPAWNTGKPLSPKLVIMDLRQHLYNKAPYLLAGGETADETALAAVGDDARKEAERSLVGVAEFNEGGHSISGGVIDPDVLWSCTTCGACVEQCPVDIEHVDHIVDMRRYQVLIESQFPSELNGLFRNLEGPGNPWGMAQSGRMDWAKGLDFEVPVVGVQAENLAEFDYLFWVGCAGAFEDRAKKTTQAVAELLHHAGVSFAVLGEGETCTGDSARRSGNEFVFQMLAQQNVEVLNEAGAKRIVVTCPHCFNTLSREYPQLGGEYEVVHHTQLLNRLVRDKRLVPVERIEQKITYHDPCYLGRHNQVYEPPRELIESVPGMTLTEAPRSKERSFCCGAGGARMWMEEKIGTRINANRAEELVATKAETVAVACPFCRVMVTDGVNAIDPDNVEVRDVAQLLLRSVKGS
ncbi:heterodisulfide reductase-related iron-sulfur binding cluster [Jatrophihabitans sp. DSM 45814]